MNTFWPFFLIFNEIMVENGLVLQNYMDVVKSQPGSDCNSCITSNDSEVDDDDENQVIDVKFEEDTHAEVEQNPVPITFKLIKSKLEEGDIFVCPLLCNIHRYLTLQTMRITCVF
jgi:hypothetical protein